MTAVKPLVDHFDDVAGFMLRMVWCRMVRERADHYHLHYWVDTLANHRADIEKLNDDADRLQGLMNATFIIAQKRHDPASVERTKQNAAKNSAKQAKLSKARARWQEAFDFNGVELRAYYAALELLLGDPTPAVIANIPVDVAAAQRWLKLLAPSQASFNSRLEESGLEPVTFQQLEVAL